MSARNESEVALGEGRGRQLRPLDSLPCAPCVVDTNMAPSWSLKGLFAWLVLICGKFSLTMFATVAARFMSEDDEEQMKEELKEAFRIYDRDGQGFITTDVLKEILREIDSTLTEDDLLNIIEEVDEDQSGTLDFDEFQEMMMG